MNGSSGSVVTNALFSTTERIAFIFATGFSIRITRSMTATTEITKKPYQFAMQIG